VKFGAPIGRTEHYQPVSAGGLPSVLRPGETGRDGEPYRDCCNRLFAVSLLPSHPRQVDSSNAEKQYMKGHWYGIYIGSNSGEMVVEIDDMGDHFRGHAYVYDKNTSLPSTFVTIRTADKANRIEFTAELLPIDPDTQEPTNWQQVASRYPGVNMSQRADVKCHWSEDWIALEWQTNTGGHGQAQLLKGQVNQPSAYQPLPVTNRSQFIEHVKALEHYRYMYRGQRHTSRLRTPFHRTGRADIRRYFQQDIQTLRAYLSARTSHFYDLRDPIQNAAFFHLIQHHRYPTPLLDWTYSPFVAAYFAYHPITSADAARASPDEKVRIFVFDKMQWCSDIPQIGNVWDRRPHFSIVEPVAIENERMVPQQALSSWSTIDDIEDYIDYVEKEKRKRYLQVIDLPVRDRDHVLRELRLMGITQGSLFPGLDGACEDLRDRFFGC
jgi:hypothetical protein